VRDPGNDQGPVNDDDATTSATDDSSVGFGNRPEEFLEDTSPHAKDLPADGPPEEPGISKERDIDSRKTDKYQDIDEEREPTGIPGAPGNAAKPEDEVPD